MIIVHDIFVCKPGNASKVAKLMKSMPFDPKRGPYVMTDMTGQYHRVIMASNYESLADYENHLKEMEEGRKNPPKGKEKEEDDKWKDFHNMYISGSREIYKVW